MKNFTMVDNRLFREGRYLTSNAFRVYVTLKSFENNETGRIFPSYEKIMERSGLSRNMVAAGLAELEQFSWIIRHRKFNKSTSYDVSHPTVYNVKDGERVGLAEDQTAPTELQAAEWARSERERRNKKRNSQERLSQLRQRWQKKVADQILADEMEIPF